MKSGAVLRSSSHRPFHRSTLAVTAGEGCLRGSFEAMASPCEILFDTSDEKSAFELLEIGAAEAWRIETKFSRYVPGNIIDRINNAHGEPMDVDEETARLLSFADRAYQMSDGLFDVTSGILRRAWTFDGREQVVDQTLIDKLLERVGWNKVRWDNPQLQLQTGMELDLGGIGKEYAVDRTLQLIRGKTDMAVLVNFGGDVAAAGQRRDGRPWRVGIEIPDQAHSADNVIELEDGAVATSGDGRKFVLVAGRRYGHILNPRTGWPVAEAPKSVTVASRTCTEAGFLSTFGILSGKDADAVLTEADVPHWCY